MFSALFLLAIVALLFYAFYKWVTINNDFFKRRNIKYMKPKFLIGNNVGVYFNQYTAAEFSEKLYQEFPNES